MASGGRSASLPATEWNTIDGAFRRVPLGKRKVGRIALSGEPIEEPDLAEPLPDWVARRTGSGRRNSRVCRAAADPSRRGLGVLAVFARQAIAHNCMDWLRTIADHAAAAINTSRAFAEIDGLRKRLELENEYLREEIAGAGAFGELIGQIAAA